MLLGPGTSACGGHGQKKKRKEKERKTGKKKKAFRLKTETKTKESLGIHIFLFHSNPVHWKGSKKPAMTVPSVFNSLHSYVDNKESLVL